MSPLKRRVKKEEIKETNYARTVFVLVGSFVTGLFFLGVVFSTLPTPPEEDLAQFPSLIKLLTGPSVKDFLILKKIASAYVQSHFKLVSFVFCGTYIMLQTFAIPGPVVLSVLGGSLFGRYWGLLYVTIGTVFGSLFCRRLFQYTGKPVFDRLTGIDQFRRQVIMQEKSGNLFWWFVFLRITPFLPNWFINITSGNVGVPLWVFVLGTTIGLIPNNFVFVGIGNELAALQDEKVFAFSWQRTLSFVAIGLLALLPIGMKSISHKLGVNL